MSEIEANMCGKRYVSNMADNIRKTSFKLGRSQNEFGLTRASHNLYNVFAQRRRRMNQLQAQASSSTKPLRCIPLNLHSDIRGRSGAWVEWSCIWLAHLLEKMMLSITK